MSLSKDKQNVLDNIDKGLSDIAVSIAKDSMKRMNESNAKYLSLHNLILTLAVGIAGVIIPLLNEHSVPSAQQFLLIALIIFGIDVLFGVTALALGLSQEQLEIPISQERLLALVASLRIRLRQARETGDSQSVGQEIEELKRLYNEIIDGMMPKINWWMRKQDLIFYGTFVAAFLVLLIGLILNFA